MNANPLIALLIQAFFQDFLVTQRGLSPNTIAAYRDGIKLLGKGRKERACPLWPETVQALQNYLEHRKPPTTECPSVFLNANGNPITRFGIRYIVRKYAAKAGGTCASMKATRVNPHTVRHTTAMHLLQLEMTR